MRFFCGGPDGPIKRIVFAQFVCEVKTPWFAFRTNFEFDDDGDFKILVSNPAWIFDVKGAKTVSGPW